MFLRLMNRMVQEEDTGGEGGSGGAANLTGGDPDTAGSMAPEPTTVEGTVEEGWLKGIDNELAQSPSMQKFSDVGGIVKSYLALEKQMGKNKIVTPDEFATKEDWDQIYDKLGRPAREKYELDFGKSEYTDDFKKGFIDKAHQNGMLPKQAQELLGYFNEQVSASTEESSKAAEQALADGDEALKKEWGSGFEKNLRVAQIALKQFADEETMNYLAESKLAQDPNLIKLFSKIGQSLNEDTFARETVRHLGVTPEEANAKIAEVNTDFNHPYWNEGHENHKKAHKEMARWYSIANPEEQKVG